MIFITCQDLKASRKIGSGHWKATTARCSPRGAPSSCLRRPACGRRRLGATQRDPIPRNHIWKVYIITLNCGKSARRVYLVSSYIYTSNWKVLNLIAGGWGARTLHKNSCLDSAPKVELLGSATCSIVLYCILYTMYKFACIYIYIYIYIHYCILYVTIIYYYIIWYDQVELLGSALMPNFAQLQQFRDRPRNDTSKMIQLRNICVYCIYIYV